MKKEYKFIATKCLCNLGGIGIMEINEESVKSGYCFGNGTDAVYTTKLRYDLETDRFYFNRYKERFYLDEFMRV